MKLYTLTRTVLLVCLFFEEVQAQRPSIELNDTLTLQELIQRYGEPEVTSPNAGGLRDNRPNIIFIMADDSRWDSYSCNGAPSFFQTPNIDRIANEGANFKYFFSVFPLCSPSRATFLTGKYPHRTGVVNNAAEIQGSFPWISSILRDGGYYTGLAGKLGFDPDSIRGFDKYMISVNESYSPAKYSYWTGDTAVTVWLEGHTTDIITEYVVDMIDSRPPDKPFFIYLPHRAPHVPYIPRPQEAHLYEDIPMPYPGNSYKYQTNFPSYYYPFNESGDSLVQDTAYRGYFQMLAGVEATTGNILNYLESIGILDNTLIIYTSDNGNIKSEHKLQGKQLPQEESIRLPLFMRYPGWFPEPKIIYDVMGINTDWMPTLLDAAEIPDTFASDGFSLRALANHTVIRDAFLYEEWRENETPPIRAVRTKYFKFIRSYCTDTTEQLFDMINDPQENDNLINDSAYQTLANYYRCKLDSLRAALDDNAVDTILQCHLKSPDSTHIGASSNPGPIFTCILPPVDGDTTFLPVGVDELTLNLNDQYEMSVYNLFGNLVSRHQVIYTGNEATLLLSKEALNPGLYILVLKNENMRRVLKVVLQ